MRSQLRSQLTMWLSGQCDLNVHAYALPESYGLSSGLTLDNLLGDCHIDLN